jgi:hypothetical protein
VNGRGGIQGFDVIGVAAVFDSVLHLRGHTQEFVHMTRHLHVSGCRRRHDDAAHVEHDEGDSSRAVDQITANVGGQRP